MEKQSSWLEGLKPLNLPRLKGRIKVDVLIVGGGITGVTTAWLLQQEGLSVALVDIQTIGGGETSHTTAHVTFVTDTRLHELVSRVGGSKAQALWDAGRAAMGQIEQIAQVQSIACDLRHAPGYLFAALDRDQSKERESLQKDAELAVEFGFDAVLLEADPLFQRPAIRFPDQMKFHPLKYLYGIAHDLVKQGAHLFERTSGSDIDADKHEMHFEGGTIAYGTLVAATHVPIQGERGTLGAALFQTKLAAYSSYAIEAKVAPTAEALFWDTDDPYHYLRFDRAGEQYSVIFGGEDHKTGQEDSAEEHYDRLEKALKKSIPSAVPRRRWSGQVLETPDGLPYIGEVGDHQLLATGFSGNGMTLGTFSAMILRDLITAKKNPWNNLFDPQRKVWGSAWEYLTENKDFPLYFLKDRLQPTTEEKIHRCSGEVIKIEGKKCAVYLDEHGKRTVLSAVCPHMGCIVRRNDAEKTWDCPCHGSRFGATGKLIAGPAEQDLSPGPSSGEKR